MPRPVAGYEWPAADLAARDPALNPESPPPVTWRALLRKSFGPGFWVFLLLAVCLGWICYTVLGPEVFREGVAHDLDLILDLLPRVAAAQLAAGFVWVLVPRDKMAAFVRRNSGRRGLLLAMIAGAITPGGPASAFPLLAILAAAGADRGILVAYITSWALLGAQRLIVWDIPFMGIEFSVLRLLISLPLPIIAGLIARRLHYDSGAPGSPGDGAR